ncbi:MAG: arginase [Gammaproteobacteria bacterium]
MPLRRTALIHAPFSGGAGVPGCELAPAVLRRAGIVRRIRRYGGVVRETACDLDANGVAGRASHAEVAKACASVYRMVGSALRKGEVPVLLGGDHSLSIGSVGAAAEFCRQRKRPLRVLWFDAHADFNTPVTSHSGNAHGMPVAVLCGVEGTESLASLTPFSALDPSSIHLIGVRALDDGEEERVRASPLAVSTMHAVITGEVQSLLDRVLAEVAAGGGRLHVSLDVDVLDPEAAPGVGTPEANGMRVETLRGFFRAIAASGLLSSVDVMEFNPLRDRGGKTARVVTDLLVELLVGQRAMVGDLPLQSELGGGL